MLRRRKEAGRGGAQGAVMPGLSYQLLCVLDKYIVVCLSACTRFIYERAGKAFLLTRREETLHLGGDLQSARVSPGSLSAYAVFHLGRGVFQKAIPFLSYPAHTDAWILEGT